MRVAGLFTVGVCALALAGCDTMSQRELTGTALGGALGAVVGGQFGGGPTERVLSAGLGAALGGYLGNRIGHAMDEQDRAEHDRAAQEALWSSRSGYASRWTGDDASGQVTPLADSYRDGRGRLCRPYSDVVTFRDGYRRTVQGTACRDADGMWVVVD